MIKYAVTGDKPVIQFLDTLGSGAVARVQEAVGVMTLRLSRLAQSKVSGGLVDAIRSGTSVTKGPGKTVGIVGTVGAPKKVAIAAVTMEYGGDVAARVLTAIGDGKLKFQFGGGFMFRKEVHIPAFSIPARSFLRSSLKQLTPEIVSTIAKAANPFWGRVL